jgi:hypothetical protein
MLAYNMAIPPNVRALVLGRTPNPGDMLTKMAFRPSSPTALRIA